MRRTSPIPVSLGIASAIGGLLLAGCGPLWNAANRSSLTVDVREVLGTAGVVPERLECGMTGTSRQAACPVSLSPAQVESVVRTFALERIDLSPESTSPLARLVAGAGTGCVGLSKGSVTAFGIAGRPKSLRLGSGRAFEYLLLSVVPSTGQACVLVCYSYG